MINFKFIMSQIRTFPIILAELNTYADIEWLGQLYASVPFVMSEHYINTAIDLDFNSPSYSWFKISQS